MKFMDSLYKALLELADFLTGFSFGWNFSSGTKLLKSCRIFWRGSWRMRLIFGKIVPLNFRPFRSVIVFGFLMTI